MYYDAEVPVLIVGGSVVGLSAALFLGWHGVPALLVERHSTTSMHPRAGSFNERTMELFRQVGMTEAIFVRETPLASKGEMGLRVESLAGRVLDSTEFRAHQQASFINPFASPARAAVIGQDKLEPLLRARASELGCDIRFGTELVDCQQESGGVRALIRERATGQERRIFAQYVIAADGHRSLLRQQSGIGSYGYGKLGQWVSILFRTDLSKILGERKIALCFVNNATVDGILGQSADHWALFAHVKPRAGEADTLAPERCLELVRAALGLPEQPVELISTLPWELAARVAERYQEGRIFLAGDAAHVMTTMGAFGANTGIADAHNLAWKLAFVLNRQASPALLASYGQERQPAADLAVGVSTGLYVYRLAHLEQREAILRSANELLERVRPGSPERQPTAFSVIQGYRYRSVAVLPEDEEEDGVLFENEPSARPGTRAPHIWLTHHGQRISILDLYGKHFVLLTGPDGQGWRHVFQQHNFPLESYTIGADQPYRDTDASFLATYGLSSSGAVLVRPDGFIAWRARQAASGETTILTRLLGR